MLPERNDVTREVNNSVITPDGLPKLLDPSSAPGRRVIRHRHGGLAATKAW